MRLRTASPWGAHSKVGWKKRAEGVKVPKLTLCTFVPR